MVLHPRRARAAGVLQALLWQLAEIAIGTDSPGSGSWHIYLLIQCVIGTPLAYGLLRALSPGEARWGWAIAGALAGALVSVMVLVVLIVLFVATCDGCLS